MPEKLYHSKFKSPKGKREFEDWYHTILSRSNSIYILKQVETRYGSTRVAISGSENGIPLVFLHGWSGNGMVWELNNLLHTVSDRYKIHLVDVIGQPNNSSNATPEIKGNGYGHWLTDVMDGLSLPTANFIGMSLGGFLIVKLA
jgi:2-hydroxy-6-oxonona-2,4-dienedioate hydrolase